MPRCRICTDRLSLPYTQCAECVSVNICLACFAQGSSTTVHSAKHKYKVIHGGIAVTSKSWSGSEDLKLLTAIQEYGLGNWEMIATLVPTKTESECFSHFYKYFVNEPQKALSIHGDTKYDSVRVCMGDRQVKDLFPQHIMLAKRGEWEHDYIYNNKAEEDFLFGEGGCEIIENLQVGIMEKYRLVQKKRNLLTNLLHEHGEVLMGHTPPPDPAESPLHQENKVIEIRDSSEEPPFPKTSILKMCRFLTKERLSHICESHTKISELRKTIKRLQDGRRLGIKSHYGLQLYKELKAKRMPPQHTYTKSIRDIYYKTNTPSNVRRKNVCSWLSSLTDDQNFSNR